MIDFWKKIEKVNMIMMLVYNALVHTHRTTHTTYLTISSYIGNYLNIIKHFTFLDHNKHFLTFFLILFIFLKYLLLKYDKKQEH